MGLSFGTVRTVRRSRGDASFVGLATLVMRLSILFAVFAVAPLPLLADEEFRFSYVQGDRYRILSTVNEDVFVDRTFSHHAEILNRIAVEVIGAEDGSGEHRATFVTSETSEGASGGVFRWGRDYESVFWRDALGRYRIADEYYMPVVRDVPVFPGRSVSVGDTWTAPGEEVHDFRDSFGLSAPYRVPFEATYRYVGEREFLGKRYPAFSVSYRIFHEAPEPDAPVGVWPYRLMGASDQTVYWDANLGQPAAYQERFRFLVELSNGRSVEYRGEATASVVEAAPMDRKKVEAEVRGAVEHLGIDGASVAADERGVTISLEDVRFRPDSAELLDSEKAKLDRIARILASYPDRDVLVTGHTALAGTEAGRRQLSEERAAAVAGYLTSIGARSRERILVKGVGADFPVADNGTEEGRKKNRRVEITLLEN